MAHVRSQQAGGRRMMHSETRLPIETVITNIIYFIFGVIEILLALRFVLLLFGANPNAGFTQLIYGLTAPLMAPFDAVFGETVVQGAVFEWSALLAIAMYALLAWLLASLVHALSPRASAGTTEIVEESAQDSAADVSREPVAGDRYPNDGDRTTVIRR